MKLMRLFGSVLAAGVLVSGCGKGPEDEKTWSPRMENFPKRTIAVGKPMGVPQMADDDIVVAVNGETLTKREVDLRLGRFRFFMARNRGANQQQLQAKYKAYGRSLVHDFIGTAVATQAARDEKVLDRAAVVSNVQQSVDMTLEAIGLSREDFDAKVPGGVKSMAESLENALWVDAYLKRHIKPDESINSNLVAQIKAQIDAENAQIAASNAVIRARLAEARERIVSKGEPFGKVADAVSEDDTLERDGTGYYGKFAAGTIMDEAQRKAFFAMSVGDVSEIFEEDDGYAFYSVTEYEPAVVKNGVEEEEAKVTLARVFVKKHDLVVLAWGDDPVRDMRKQDYDRKASDWIVQLRAKADIVYPHGTNFWSSAQRERANPAKNK